MIKVISLNVNCGVKRKQQLPNRNATQRVSSGTLKREQEQVSEQSQRKPRGCSVMAASGGRESQTALKGRIALVPAQLKSQRTWVFFVFLQNSPRLEVWFPCQKTILSITSSLSCFLGETACNKSPSAEQTS